MAKKKIAISLDEGLLELIDGQRGNEKRSTYINSIIATHFGAEPKKEGGSVFVTSLELRKTLKPVYDRLVALDGLAHDVKDLQDFIRSK